VNWDVVVRFIAIVDGGTAVAFARLQFEAVAAVAITQVTVTELLKPAKGVKVAVVVVPSPATTWPDVGFSETEKSTPVPVSDAFSPLYSKLAELTPTVPASGPVTVGRNVTLIGQVAPAAIELPQAAVLTEYCPVVTNGGIGSGPEARLVSVSDWVAEPVISKFPKASEVPESA